MFVSPEVRLFVSNPLITFFLKICTMIPTKNRIEKTGKHRFFRTIPVFPEMDKMDPKWPHVMIGFFKIIFIWIRLVMKYVSVQISYLGIFRFPSYRPKCPWPVRLQHLRIGNVSRMN